MIGANIFRQRGWDILPNFFPRPGRALKLGLLGLAAAVCAFYAYGVYRGGADLDSGSVRVPEVTAHRGASKYCPENTMAAFRKAAHQGAQWLELDVRQSRDGHLFVMHDQTFLRTAGVDMYAWELDFEEIHALDAGRFFGTEYAGEHIPLLSEVIGFAKERGLRLNIEVKSSSRTPELEKNLVALVREMNFEDGCVVTSQNYQCIEKIKEYNENITTVYIMDRAYGIIGDLAAADHFSVNYRYVTRQLVEQVHGNGKQIYVWTVNRRENAREMADVGVDNIITDDVPMVRSCLGGMRPVQSWRWDDYGRCS